MYRFLITLSMVMVAGSTAFMSVYGLVAVFPACPALIIILGIGIELGKLLLVVHLHRNWGQMHFTGRFFYMVVAGVLVLLTSCEVMGYLSLSHKTAVSGTEVVVAVDAGLVREADLLASQVATIDKTLAGLPDGHVSRRISERKNAGYDAKQRRLLEIARERAELSRKIHEGAPAAGPVFAVADLFGLPRDRVAFSFILLLVAILEPLAIGLTIAVSAAWQNGRPTASAAKGLAMADVARSLAVAETAGQTAMDKPAEPVAKSETAGRPDMAERTATPENTGVAVMAETLAVAETADPLAVAEAAEPLAETEMAGPLAVAETDRPNHDRLMAIQRRFNFSVEKLAEITGRKQLKTVRTWLEEDGSEIPDKALRKVEKYVRGKPVRLVEMK